MVGYINYWKGQCIHGPATNNAIARYTLATPSFSATRYSHHSHQPVKHCIRSREFNRTGGFDKDAGDYPFRSDQNSRTPLKRLHSCSLFRGSESAFQLAGISVLLPIKDDENRIE